jgi:septin family protein
MFYIQITVIRKKLQGYVGFANLPNQVHRKSVKTGFQFTCMVVGKVIEYRHFFKKNCANYNH